MVLRVPSFFIIVVVLQILSRKAICVYVRDDSPFENIGPPNGVKYCVDLNMEDSVCSSDPIGVYKHLYNRRTLEDIHQGVEQRIDGSEEEKKKIIEVLKLMNVYWYEEVLSNIEYDEARASCKNNNNLCAFWAAVGECETNRLFMLPNCPLACRFCLLQFTL